MASIAIAALYSNIVKVTGSIPAGAQLVEHDPQRVEKLPLTLCLHFPLSLSRSLIKDRAQRENTREKVACGLFYLMDTFHAK